MIRGSGAFEYGEHFEVSMEQAAGGFTAWIERLDHGLVCCGYSISQAAGTHEYLTADAAIAAAKAAIDAGEVRLRPSNARTAAAARRGRRPRRRLTELDGRQ